MLRAVAGAFGAIAIVAVGAGYGLWRFEAPGPSTAETIVDVPTGAGINAIAERLTAAGILQEPLTFGFGVRVLGGDRPLRAGEFAFPVGTSARGAMEILQSGPTVTYSLTVPEGLTSAEVVALTAAEDKLSGEIEAIPPDGSLLPETYSFSRGDSRAALIARMQADMASLVAALWQERADGLPFDTPEQAVTLASIVEKETGVAAEREQVASVFVNRLEQRMRLQSDPTVVYALTGGKGALGRELVRDDWEFDSPYNTYRNTGLPPGPIANPGRATLEAVLHPATTDFLYFVADGSGGHAFARTLAEHNRNVAAWRRVRSQ